MRVKRFISVRVNLFIRLSGSSLILGSLLGLLFGCSTIPPKERESVRNSLEQDATAIIAELSQLDPGFTNKLSASVGYFAGSVSDVKAPFVGGAEGLGVLVDQRTGRRIYLNIDRFDVGIGLGASFRRGVVLFHDEKLFDQVKKEKWLIDSGAKISWGRRGDNTRFPEEEYSVHYVHAEGVEATATITAARLSVNRELTDNGLSDNIIPNRTHRPTGKEPPREWDHALPFLAQRVVDKGYNLPLPYGLSLIYVGMEQDQNIDNLELGVNGSPKVPFTAVIFNEARAETKTLQAKADTWLFPFLNVFGLVGYVDGVAPLNLTVDGDSLLNDLGVTPPSPLIPIFQGKEVTFDIEAKLRGITYGGGALLAGGWKGWFGTLPFSFTFIDIEGRNAEGYTVSINPRIGRVVPLNRRGSIAVYGGAQVLYNSLTIDGTYTFAGTDASIDYKVDQSIKDPVNLVIGYNWSFTPSLSWGFEYGGFIGSRKSILTSLGWRF